MLVSLWAIQNWKIIQYTECEGPLQPEVVWDSRTSSRKEYNASNLLTLSNRDIYEHGKHRANYWLANGGLHNQGFIMKVHSCKRWIAGFRIQNKGLGSDSNWATKKFGVSSSQNADGPWTALVEAELEEPEDQKEAELHTFLFDEAKEIQFLKFDVISYWGDAGAGLQYFSPTLAEG